MKNINVLIYNISNNPLPKYETLLAAGMDIRADFSRITPTNTMKAYGDSEIIFKGPGHDITMLRLDPGARALIPTGLFVALPEGYELQIRPRSGLAIKEGVTVINTPGTIDADYRGEIGIPLINNGVETVWIEDGERICQAVLKEVPQIKWEVVNNKEDLGTTARGEGGFNSTGKR